MEIQEDCQNIKCDLINGDCLEEMKKLDDDSIDLIFCDLPYGQTSCKWDCKIDLELFWKEVMRIKKLHTPIFFTTTTKFGVELIQSAPKKCFFRYDLVWVKSSSAGFLCAKKMPLRKHEMIYVFYEKLPFYDLSSHSHKFIKETVNKRSGKDGIDNKGMIKNRSKTEIQNKYDPPLPVSIVTEGTNEKEEIIEPNEDYDKREKKSRNTIKKQENYGKGYLDKKVNFRKYDPKLGGKGAESNIYDPPLPNSMLEIKSTRGKHSTEKSVAIMEWILKYYSKEGDVTLNPTCGSGSTGVACKNMKRNFIGIEMDSEIFEIAKKRNNQ